MELEGAIARRKEIFKIYALQYTARLKYVNSILRSDFSLLWLSFFHSHLKYAVLTVEQLDNAKPSSQNPVKTNS